MNIDQKVFGIGFHKTGTKSLKKALEILGYSVTGPNAVQEIDSRKKLYEVVDSFLPQYNAFQDNPWPLVYKYVDNLYPDAKFILTIRDDSMWIQSVVKYFKNKTTPMRKYIYGYGSPLGNEDIYLQCYKKHNQEVINYFKDKNNKLLVIDITKENAWEQICLFLNKPKPTLPFPHLNKNRNKIL